MAETVVRQRLAKAGLADRVSVESAGTGGWHVGERADPRAVAALREHGYQPHDHTGRQFRASWFAMFDLILAMDQDNLADLRRLAPTEEAGRSVRLLRTYDPAATDGDLDVPDPYYGGADGFTHVLAQIERAADGLVDVLQEELRDR